MRRLIPMFAIVLGCGALVLATACTSNGKLGPASAGTPDAAIAEQTLPAGHPTVDPKATEVPVEALLGEADLGADWAQGTHQEDPLAPMDSYYCGKKVPSIPWTQVAQFANTQTSNRLIEILAQYPDEAAAQAALKQERDATAGCDTWASSTGADQIDWHIESVDTLDFGDEAFVETSSTQAGDPPQRAVDVAVLVRKGDVVILIDEGGSGDVDGAETTAAARKALDKLVKALGAS